MDKKYNENNTKMMSGCHCHRTCSGPGCEKRELDKEFILTDVRNIKGEIFQTMCCIECHRKYVDKLKNLPSIVKCSVCGKITKDVLSVPSNRVEASKTGGLRYMCRPCYNKRNDEPN